MMKLYQFHFAPPMTTNVTKVIGSTSAGGVITMCHQLHKCQPYKLFSFIYDCDKGLNPALQEGSPQNHHTNCLYHIRSTMKVKLALKASCNTKRIGRTFSQRQEE